MKSIPSITSYQVFSSNSDPSKYFPVKFKDQNKDSIDQIESRNKHEAKIPRTSRKENIIYIYNTKNTFDQSRLYSIPS